jgi:Uma2 family endonuclease
MKHASLTLLSVKDYLALEQRSEVKHEYVGGQIFAMVGVRDVHNTVALNIASRLRDGLRGGPCRVYIADMKVRVDSSTWQTHSYYPDVFVTCDGRDMEAYFKRHPVLVIEVLSPATETVDRREKLRNYRLLDTLEEYVLVSLERRQVEIYRREGPREWGVDTLNPGDDVALATLGLTLGFGDIYEDTGI